MEDQRHSGFGIASFITSIVSGILIFLVIITAGVIQVSTPRGLNEQSATAMTIGMFLFVFLFVSLVALGLGIVGLLQKERKKIFAILGTVFSAVTIVATISIIFLGIAMK